MYDSLTERWGVAIYIVMDSLSTEGEAMFEVVLMKVILYRKYITNCLLYI